MEPAPKSQGAFFSDQPDQMERVYGRGRMQYLQQELSFVPDVITSENFEQYLPDLQEVQVIFSTWGMLPLTAEQIANLPALKIVFYAAGSVQYFARPFLQQGVQVVSAWAANAVPVAQVTLAQIILASKGYFTAERLCRTPEGREEFTQHYPGMFGLPIALLGAGMVGRRVIELLKLLQLDRSGDLQLLVFDPFLSSEDAARLGVVKVSLEEAFERGFVISNHIANLPETEGMLTTDLFARMQPYATFINTGRGATVDEAGMLEVMAQRPDLTALLDVTFPEPPLPDSPIYRLENVLLSPHTAGSIGPEVLRQADYMIEEWQRYRKGEPLLYAVTLEMLKTMA